MPALKKAHTEDVEHSLAFLGDFSLLFEAQPQYATHVYGYTKKDVEEHLERHGFMVLEAYYSYPEVNDCVRKCKTQRLPQVLTSRPEEKTKSYELP